MHSQPPQQAVHSGRFNLVSDQDSRGEETSSFEGPLGLTEFAGSERSAMLFEPERGDGVSVLRQLIAPVTCFWLAPFQFCLAELHIAPLPAQ